MAHARTADNDARLIKQCSMGRRIRNIWAQPAILADARTAIDTESHILATVIDGEVSANVGIGVAPCVAEVTRCYVNAKTFPTTSGAATITFYKAVIGGSDVALNTAIDIDAPTAETAIDGVLSTTSGALDLLEGQEVYAVIALSAITSVRSDGLIMCVEWIPKDKS